jgi:hypothetical protein
MEGRMSFETTALLLSWSVLLLLSAALAALARQVRALSTRLPPLGLAAGSRAPEADRLALERSGPTLLLFLSTSCGACPDVYREALRLAGDQAVVPMRAIFPERALPLDGAEATIPVHPGERALFDAYRVPATPFAVLVEKGRVRRAEPIRSSQVLQELSVPGRND